jgi:hypothetical protein
MSASLLVRRALVTVGFGGLALAGACTESSVIDPGTTQKPNLVVAQTVTTVGWDFTGLIGTAPGVQDWGMSKTIGPNGTNGTMVASTNLANTHVTSKGFELGVGNTERGLGLCYILSAGGPCSGDEVGDDNRQDISPFSHLYVNMNGVLPTGSTLTQIDLGSVQTTEGWRISYSTTGIGGAYSLLNAGVGDGTNNAGDNVTITGAPLPLSTVNLVLRFEKNTAASGNTTADNDYVVKSVTTSFNSFSGCTYTWGYWKTHDGSKRNIPNVWPVSSLTLGTRTYTKAELQSILGTPVAGNGLIDLAHQLIAAKLSIANGAGPAPQAVADADALIGSKVIPPVGSGYIAPADASALVTLLDSFNSGLTGPGHCGDEIVPQ